MSCGGVASTGEAAVGRAGSLRPVAERRGRVCWPSGRPGASEPGERGGLTWRACGTGGVVVLVPGSSWFSGLCTANGGAPGGNKGGQRASVKA